MTDISHMLNQTIEVAKAGSRDRYGAYSYGATTEYPARIQEKIDMVKDAEGREVVSESTVYVAADIDYNDKIIIDGEEDISILAISHVHDFDGNFVYCEVKL
jgi:hypothetical protein